MTVICEISAQFSGAEWNTPSPCPEWRAADLAGHLRCVADDFHEYLDDAPASRLARLMATGVPPDTLARKLARQNAAELAALPDASGPEHIEAFASSARSYGQRLLPIWDLPHHQYRDVLVTVGGMAGAACAEWHLHAWDLARALGKDYRPADPDILLSGWIAGMPHLPPDGAGLPGGLDGAVPEGTGPGETGAGLPSPRGAGPHGAAPDGPAPARAAVGGRGLEHAATKGAAVARGQMLRLAAAAVREDPWLVMLRASGRIPLGRSSPGPVL